MFLKNNKGLSLVEAIVGLWLMAWMLSFYLPAVSQQLKTYSQLKTQQAQWQKFYQLASIALADLSAEDRNQQLEEYIEQIHLLDGSAIHEFSCDEFACQIHFERGDAYLVEIQTIHDR